MDIHVSSATAHKILEASAYNRVKFPTMRVLKSLQAKTRI